MMCMIFLTSRPRAATLDVIMIGHFPVRKERLSRSVSENVEVRGVDVTHMASSLSY